MRARAKQTSPRMYCQRSGPPQAPSSTNTRRASGPRCKAERARVERKMCPRVWPWWPRACPHHPSVRRASGEATDCGGHGELRERALRAVARAARDGACARRQPLQQRGRLEGRHRRHRGRRQRPGQRGGAGRAAATGSTAVATVGDASFPPPVRIPGAERAPLDKPRPSALISMAQMTETRSRNWNCSFGQRAEAAAAEAQARAPHG